MTINIKKLEADMRGEARKFLVQIVLGAAACAGAGAAVATLVLHLTGKI